MNAPVRPSGLRTARAFTRWPPCRVARLGFLVGRGLDAAAVAGDPRVASTATNVHRQARRFGLAFRDVTAPKLSRAAARRVEAAARRRGLDRDALLGRLLVAATSDVALIDNILDDGVETKHGR